MLLSYSTLLTATWRTSDECRAKFRVARECEVHSKPCSGRRRPRRRSVAGQDWWQRVSACLCPRGAFSHVVGCTRQTSALRDAANSTPPLTASVGCCYPRHPPPGSSGPLTRIRRPATLLGPGPLDADFQVRVGRRVARHSWPPPRARPGQGRRPPQPLQLRLRRGAEPEREIE